MPRGRGCVTTCADDSRRAPGKAHVPTCLQLDNKRNQLLGVDLLLTTCNAGTAFIVAVTALFAMNLKQRCACLIHHVHILRGALWW